MKTINVIKIYNGEIYFLKSFEDNERGNLAAEAIFIEFIQKYEPVDRSTFKGIESYIKAGKFVEGLDSCFLVKGYLKSTT